MCACVDDDDEDDDEDDDMMTACGVRGSFEIFSAFLSTTYTLRRLDYSSLSLYHAYYR